MLLVIFYLFLACLATVSVLHRGCSQKPSTPYLPTPHVPFHPQQIASPPTHREPQSQGCPLFPFILPFIDKSTVLISFLLTWEKQVSLFLPRVVSVPAPNLISPIFFKTSSSQSPPLSYLSVLPDLSAKPRPSSGFTNLKRKLCLSSTHLLQNTTFLAPFFLPSIVSTLCVYVLTSLLSLFLGNNFYCKMYH